MSVKHKLNANLIYEWQEKLRIAYEGFYVGNQHFSSYEKVKKYWVMGVSGKYKFRYFSVFLNLENFLDSRQSKWEICTREQFRTHNLEKFIPQQKDLF